MNFPANYEWPPLMAKLNAAGVLGNEEASQALIDDFAIDEARAWLKTQIADFARVLQDSFLEKQNYSAGEASSWPIKRAEAVLFKTSGRSEDAPLLSVEATASGRALAELADRVLANATAYSAFTATCAGLRTRHQKALDTLTTFEDLLAYNYHAGWPV